VISNWPGKSTPLGAQRRAAAARQRLAVEYRPEPRIQYVGWYSDRRWFIKGPWVVGVLANNIWSLGGAPGFGGVRYSTFLTQPFVNYNFGEG
jgi:hypothetical protein